MFGGMKKSEEMVGKRFGKLFVESFAGIWVSSTQKTKNNQWKCICDCGNVSLVRSSKLKDGSTKSCGCAKYEKLKLPRTNPGQAGKVTLYLAYKTRSKRLGIEFSLSFDRFIEITQKDCLYCGRKPSHIFTPKGRDVIATKHGIYVYNGIDKIDKSKGYTEGNCAPCCKHCNMAKSDMSQQDFVIMVKNIYNNFAKNY